VKKKMMILSMTLLCICSPVTVFAQSIDSEVQLEEGTRITARAEKVQWYYRYHNGVKQKRLWSVTYGQWKTKWMNC